MKKFYFKLSRQSFTVLLGLFCATPLLAQTGKTVTGTVKELQVPLVGVMVKEEGTDNSTFTDSNGQYSLTLQQDDAKLIFEQLDFPIREEEVLNRNVINVRFTKEEEGIQLKDVVVNAGYYSVKDKERTGSIARVTAKEIENQPVNNVLDALQGRVAGLEITPTTGTAGGGYTIRLRGQNSINAGNDPLFIIDGVPFDMNSMSYTSISNTVMPNSNINPLNSIDPKSIEKIEVLKDADATAIYGSRGANGVILITTKKGEKGKTTFNIDSSISVNSITKKVNLLNTEQYLMMRKKAFENDGITNYPTNAYDINGAWDQTRYTDWQKVLIGNTGTTNNTRLNIMGGSEQTSFMIGSNFMKETSVLYGDYKYKKLNAFVNLNHSSKDNRFKVGTVLIYGDDNNVLPIENLARTAKKLAPNAPALFDENGNLNWENNTWTNPIASTYSTYRSHANVLNTSFNMSYALTDQFTFKTNLGYNHSILKDKSFNLHTVRNPAYGNTSADSSVIMNENEKEVWSIEPQLDYHLSWTNSEITLNVGATFMMNEQNQLVTRGVGFADNALMNVMSAAKTFQFLQDISSQYKYNAIYGRFNYSLYQKYILNLTARRDGSSRFGEANKLANFGAIGAAWIFSKENFLNESSWLSFGKLRGSYGITGNDQIGDYQYLSTYSIKQDGYDGTTYLTPSRLHNPNFSWEKNRKIEGAIELAFLKNRLNLEVNYYHNQSNNQLIGYSLPATTGFKTIQANLDAVVVNKGLEIALHSTNIKKDKWQWETSFLITFPKNKLKAFENLAQSSYSNQYVIGQSINITKLYNFIGINPVNGTYMFEDYNNDGKISSADDRKVYTDFNPKWYGSLGNTIRYNNWNLEVLFQFSKKKAYNELHTLNAAGTFFNQPVSVMDEGRTQIYTTGSNTNAVVAQNYFYTSTGVVSDASFVRLKSLSINYNVPLKKNYKVVLYAQGFNLLTLTKYKGGDPEQIEDFLPPLKRIAFGTTISF
ncbi:SusC/RagA family TonB-linked outer membrane protein [Empedobacter stercoris]|uniref:SusC/RagA family TonB-linked outer membrane protein n=1 Tax=Empedobacter stercoris TaxID=1628248 RepID=UPI00294FFCFE|nr:SusC/RagA family TonB-linked outer membrane protein [Empedobacter stercoris]